MIFLIKFLKKFHKTLKNSTIDCDKVFRKDFFIFLPLDYN